MARCGRCGLWNKQPDEHKEQKWAGRCLWFGHSLHKDEVWDQRECDDFIERIPELDPIEHFEHKIKLENLKAAYDTALRSKRVAYAGLTLSIAALTWNLVKELI